jgi:hypothetical protein
MPVIARMRAVTAIAAGVLTFGSAQAGSATIETRDLLVSDATGTLSRSQLEDMARQAQAVLERVLALWSADAGVDRLGKIRVVLDAPRRDVYSSVFYWEEEDGRRTRVVRVFRSEGPPQMLAHKLTSAVFPQKDKLIRNMMGIVSEVQVGNALTFPMCGFGCDAWVLALVKTRTFIPLGELGPDHESWGMKDAGGGSLSILDKARQHTAYAEAGSFGIYLLHTYGIDRLKRLHRLSREKPRPWQDAFGSGLPELEARWLASLRASERPGSSGASTVLELFEGNPGTACAEAQRLAAKGR